jgi:hypothetical protein
MPLIAKQAAVLAPVTVISMAKLAIGSWADDLGHQYRAQQLLDGPLVTGEPDIFRMLGADPRMTLQPDGPPMLRAPGVDGGRMQLLLDGFPIWNTMHGGATLSTVTPDAVSQVVTYDGAMPARFSGAFGDVLDVRTRDLTGDVSTGRVAIGPLASRAMWGMPLQAGSLVGGMIVAMRASHSALFPRMSDGQPFVDRWVDGIGRLSLSNETNSIEVLAFASGDRMTQTAPALARVPGTMLPDKWDVWADEGSAGTATTGSGTEEPGSWGSETNGTTGSTTGSSTSGTGTSGTTAPLAGSMSTAANKPGMPDIPWSSRTVGVVWTHHLATAAQLETRTWFSSMQSGVHVGPDTLAFSLPCALDDALQHMGMSSTLSWQHTAIGASVDAFDTHYRVTNVSWVSDSGAPLSLHTAPRVGALFAEQRWGMPDDAMNASVGVRATGIFGGTWYAEPRAAVSAHLGSRVTAAVGYARTHQFVQSLRNDVSPLRAIVGADFPVAAGTNGVPVARTDALTAGMATRLGEHLTLDLDTYHRQLVHVALADPINENLFAVSAFELAHANVSGAGASLTGDQGMLRWHLSYGIARTALTIANNSSFNTAPVVGRSAAAAVELAVTSQTRLQVAGWAATNQQAAQLTESGEYGQDPTGPSVGGDASLAAWLPKYRRVDVTASHSYDMGNGHGTLSMFVTAANIFNNANVATFLRAKTSASASASTVWAPVTLVPRSLQAGLSWQY